MRTPVLAGRLAAGFAALTAVLFSSLCGAEAQSGGTAITCANTTSGASWQIRIDYDRSTVDSNPARVSTTTISWRDPKDGGNYTLDRKSGNLTAIVASSTGGAFF